LKASSTVRSLGWLMQRADAKRTSVSGVSVLANVGSPGGLRDLQHD
jgi:hypothetical protein